MHLVPGVGRGHHVLASILAPLHGPAEREGGDRDERVLRVARGLGAEAPADVGGDHADPAGRQPERRGEPLLDEVGDLGAVPRREGPVAAVEGGDHAAGLDRHPDVALDPEALLEHDVGGAERGVGVADRVGEADGHVVGPVRVETRRFRPGGGHHLDHRRQRLPLDLERLGGVLGAGAAVGHDHRDDLARVTGNSPAQRVLDRRPDREADALGEPGRGGAEDGERLQEGLEVGEGEDPDDAGHGGRARGVDPAEAGVGVGRAQEGGVE